MGEADGVAMVAHGEQRIAFAVRPAMADAVSHGTQAPVGVAQSSRQNEPGDPAHRSARLASRRGATVTMFPGDDGIFLLHERVGFRFPRNPNLTTAVVNK